jgi:hypothetical protein
VQHVKNSKKKTNPIPPFAQAAFLKFATLPRDSKCHISKLASLPRAPYQPHAINNHKGIAVESGFDWRFWFSNYLVVSQT